MKTTARTISSGWARAGFESGGIERSFNVFTPSVCVAALARRLLIFSRRESMQIKPLELGGYLGNLIKMLRRVLGEHISLTLHGSTADVWVDGDVGMLKQVVTNLCVNARDAMPNGGRLTIDITRTKIDAESAKAGLDAYAGRFVCLNVSDTGCGMEEGTLRRIFESFFTTKEIGKGTLGVSTVYGIVRQPRGWVDVAKRSRQREHRIVRQCLDSTKGG